MTHWPPGDGEMAERIRALNWTATPLGPIEGWPQSLKVASRLLLNSRHPMFIWWGPELIQLYNDAYRETMGWEKHPSALGGRGRDTWMEIWDVIGPQIAQVMSGGPATWHEDQLVPVTRHGSREDVWWTYSFSPIDDEAALDGVGGVMVICRDVTAEHLAKRTAEENEARYRELFEAMEEGYLVADVIFDGDGRAVDIAYHEANPAATRMVGTDVTGRRLRDVDPAYEEHWYETFGRVARTGVSERGILYASPGDIWYDFHVSRPTTSDPTSTRIAIRFFDASVRVRTELALRQSEERQAYLLELSDALRPLADQAEIQRVAMEVLGRRLGVSRAQYYIADETGEYLSSTGGYADGVPAAIGRFRLVEFGQYAYDGFHAGQTQVVSDATTDPRISDAVLASYKAVGFLAYIGVPFVQRGRLVGTVAVHQSSSRLWTDTERMMVEETAERAGIAVEQARAEQALRESEERQAFLLKLSDTVGPLAGAADIQAETTRLLREQLNAAWCYYVDWDLDRNIGLVLRDSASERLPSLAGAHDVSDAAEFLQLLAVGAVLTVRDYASYEQLSTRIRQKFTALGFRSMVVAPLVKEGRLIASLLVGDTEVRDWSASETSLLVEVAERTWAAVERARAEVRLRESEERFQQFATASAAGLWIRDAGTLVMEYVSPAIEAIYGVQADALLGDVKRWAAMILSEDRDTALSHLETARNGEVAIHEFRIQRPSDGALRWIRNTDFPLRDNGYIPRIGGIAEDVTEAKRASELQNVMVAELQHRTRNLIAVVKGIASDTMRETGPTEVFRAAFADRLSALSRVQGLLSRSDAEPITFGSLLRLELDALGAGAAGDRVTASGPEVFLRPSTVQTLALALHELATNARKYGALSHDGGRLAVTWRTRSEAGESRLAIDWVETGLEQAPERPASGEAGGGYGRELIEQALPHALGARTSYALSAEGVRCTIDLAVRPRKGEP